MKVIVNGRFLVQKKTGVQNYANEIVNTLIKLGASPEIVIPPVKHKQYGFAVKPIGFFNGFIWEQIFLPQYVRRQNHPVLLNLCNSAPLINRNSAVTIHDLAFEADMGNWFSAVFRKWYKFLIPRISKKARVIFTVSDFSKRELINHYRLPSDKIKVVPPGLPEMSFIPDNPPQYEYVLMTGANNPRKNATWIISNISVLKERGLKLVLLGSKSNIFNNRPIKTDDDIIHLGDVSTSQYFSLIKHAKALISPSFYEGFGIPILESLSLGTPVVASNIPVFKESFGNIPLYFELGSLEGYVNAIDGIKEKVISPDEIQWLKHKYSYTRSAELIMKSIEDITIE